MKSARTRILPYLLALALVIPLAVGAVLGLSPATTWSEGGAPVDDASPTMSGIDPRALVGARQAAGAANTQAGLLKKGTDQLKEGTQQFRDKSGELTDGMNRATDASQQLSQGLVQIQAGTGQLGQGATELADGIDQVVQEMAGLEAVRGQMLTAVDQADGELKDSLDPRARGMREQLQGFRDQIANFQLDEAIKEQINRAHTGSRELANQLATPGYAYHDGIYQATQGAQQLAAGMTELQGGVGQAVDGVNQLDDGAGKIQNLAAQNQSRVQAVQRALPTSPSIAAEEAAASGENPSPMLNPIHALLIGVLMAVGGAAIAFIAGREDSRRQRLLGAIGGGAVLTILGVLLAGILGGNLGAGQLLLAAVGCALGVAVSILMTTLAWRLGGRLIAMIVAAVVLIVEVGVVGHVWSSSIHEDAHGVWSVIASLLPLNYTTMAVSTAGNSGSANALVLSLGLLLALAIIAGIGVLAARRDADSSSAPSAPRHGMAD
ncbi:hypothetical protein L1O03_00885 [Corynebacterium uropygiale]|uniref:X-X-X-Leu-X-X-Gly heptad repeat-containing protein n=1 Tax=Corynebacterium uropygiale TaxID=1775911 RepID=A0A9X1TX74_9CORY|nr:hypothetical protein [Corynebacterium uropygiale]MCF4005735.1 hypothetical protein [Corynebacterium uropygiale]